mgnify:CR=1 FL=1
MGRDSKNHTPTLDIEPKNKESLFRNPLAYTYHRYFIYNIILIRMG